VAERKVVFYECQDIENQSAFDCLAAVADINELDDADWRLPDGESDFAVIVDRKSSAPFKLRLLRIRPDTPFLLTAARELTPVEVELNESITEFTWATIWADNIMAAVSSRDAPSHKRLGFYFERTSGELTHIVNLFKPDLPQRLHELRTRGLRQVQLKVRASELHQMEADEQVRGFGQIFRAGQGTDAASIGIDLSVGRSGSDAMLSNEIGEGTEELAEQVDRLESLHVKGIGANGKVEKINVKQERLTMPVEISSGNTNREVYELIEQARRDLESDIGTLDRAARGN
jgi:hypothetical protein